MVIFAKAVENAPKKRGGKPIIEKNPLYLTKVEGLCYNDTVFYIGKRR